MLPKKDEMLGIPIYRFYYDDNASVLEAAKKLKFRPNNTNWIWEGVDDSGDRGSDLYNYSDFADLFAWMQDCMAEVAEDMGMQNKLICNAAWANLNKTHEWFFDHTHYNCMISSNYYCSGLEEDKTQWFHPNPYFHYTNIYPLGEFTEDKYLLTFTEPTEPGKFIVFPPMIRHRAWPNTSEDDRITIAANWFPTGNLNAAGVSHLRLDVIQ